MEKLFLAAQFKLSSYTIHTELHIKPMVEFSIRSLFSHTPWHYAYFDDNLDDNWQEWLDLFFATVDQCIGKRRHNNKFNPPWISKELLTLTLQAVVSPGRTLRYEGTETTASILL